MASNLNISSIENRYMNHISAFLPHFSRQLNAYRLQCPYCQLSDKDHKGRKMLPTRCKGFFYSNGNALNFKCHRCGTGKQFHTFLEDHFPPLFLEYVAERDGLGLTGKGTNAPTLNNATERVSGKVATASAELVEKFGNGIQKSDCSSDGNGLEVNQIQLNSGPTAPAITKLPRLTPQQQAGCSARLAHKVKQHQQRRQRDPAARYLQD